MAERSYKYTPVPGAGQYEMVPVEIRDQEENWTKVYLADGSVIKVKTIVTKVGRSVDRPIPDSGGEPLYHVMSRNIVVAEVPDELYFVEEEA
jgi:hypothetical protein